MEGIGQFDEGVLVARVLSAKTKAAQKHISVAGRPCLLRQKGPFASVFRYLNRRRNSVHSRPGPNRLHPAGVSSDRHAHLHLF